MYVFLYKGIVKSVNEKASDTQQLCSNASHLAKMSEEPAFVAMETRVRDIREVYFDIKQESSDKLNILQNWVQELDDYEKKVDELNVWIDSRLSMLDTIGGMSAKFDLEMELNKLKVCVCFLFISCKINIRIPCFVCEINSHDNFLYRECLHTCFRGNLK